jgi:hypothetical protein
MYIGGTTWTGMLIRRSLNMTRMWDWDERRDWNAVFRDGLEVDLERM